jgi:predicted Zn-dependent protease
VFFAGLGHALSAEMPFALQLKYEEAQTLMNHQKWPEAAIILQGVLKEAPHYSPAAIDLARSLVYSSRREEALSVLEEAVSHEKGPRRAVLIRRERVLARLFVTNETFQGFQEGVNFLDARKFGSACERLAQVLEREPDNVEILTRLGQCRLLDGDADSAAERLRLARKLSPHEPQVRLWLGRALQQRGEIEEALTELRSARQELKDSELAAIWLAEALASNGQRTAATDVLDQDVKQNPMHVESLYTSARLKYIAIQKENPQALWAVRRDLQLALSRLDDHSSVGGPGDELSYPQQDPKAIKADVQALLRRVEARLASHPND